MTSVSTEVKMPRSAKRVLEDLQNATNGGRKITHQRIDELLDELSRAQMCELDGKLIPDSLPIAGEQE